MKLKPSKSCIEVKDAVVAFYNKQEYWEGILSFECLINHFYNSLKQDIEVKLWKKIYEKENVCNICISGGRNAM